jgi:hypothetical protein
MMPMLRLLKIHFLRQEHNKMLYNATDPESGLKTQKGERTMKVTFNLYGACGFISTNTLSAEDFAEFRIIAESLKQTVRIEKVGY